MHVLSQTKLGLIAALLTLAACASAPAPRPDATSQIVSTTSFGMCVGYCTTRLEISESQVVLTRQGRSGRGASDLPSQHFTATLTPAEWRELQILAANTDLSGLPSTIGCPDCADGGAESITLGPRTVTFEFGATVDEAQPLLERVRALRERLTPAQ